jgi:O-antigen/teichoic acid export membrane protein
MSGPGRSWAASLLGEGVATAGGQVVAALGLLFGTRALTEVVPPSVFGAVSLFVGVATFGFNLLCSPVVQAALRFYPEATAQERLPAVAYALRSSIRRTTSLTVLLLLGAGAIYSQVAGSSYYEFLALSGLIVLDAARTFDWAFLNANRKQHLYAGWSAAEAWLRPLGALVFVVLFGAKVMSVLVGYAIGSLLAYAVLHRSAVPPTAAPEPAALAELRKSIASYALPLVPIAAVNWISSLSDRYLIGGTRGLADAGIYAAAYALAARPVIMLTTTLALVLRPRYYEAVSSRDPKAAAAILRLWARTCFALGMATTAAVFVSRDLIVSLLLSQRYRAAAPLLLPITLGYVFNAMAGVHAAACLALGRPSFATFIEVAAAIASLLFEIPMIRWKGAVGAAWAVPMYCGVQFVIARQLSRALLKRADLQSGLIATPAGASDAATGAHSASR